MFTVHPRLYITPMTGLSLRHLQIPHAPDAHHVMFDGLPVGSIATQISTEARDVWRWSIYETEFKGEGTDLEDCMVQFKAAWVKFARNPDRLAEFMAERRYQETGRVWNTKKPRRPEG